MIKINMSRRKAEQELLELIRHQDAQNFTLTIASDGGRWTVTTEDHDKLVKAVGQGGRFERAWFAQDPYWRS